MTPAEDFEFEEPPAPPPGKSTAGAKAEIDFYANSAKDFDPGIKFPLFGGGHLCIPDPTGATTVALFVFVALCIVVILILLLGCFTNSGGFASEVFKVIGQALLTVVGFLVGSASSAKPTRRRK